MQLFVVDPVCMLYGSFTVLSGMDLCMQQMLGESGKIFRVVGELPWIGSSYERALQEKLRGIVVKEELPRGGY